MPLIAYVSNLPSVLHYPLSEQCVAGLPSRCAQRPRDWRATAVSQSASGARLGDRVRTRNAHVMCTQRRRDLHATAVSQSASGARLGYGVRARNAHVTARSTYGAGAQREGTRKQ